MDVKNSAAVVGNGQWLLDQFKLVLQTEDTLECLKDRADIAFKYTPDYLLATMEASAKDINGSHVFHKTESKGPADEISDTHVIGRTESKGSGDKIEDNCFPNIRTDFIDRISKERQQ
jgi:hypothetical protein